MKRVKYIYVTGVPYSAQLSNDALIDLYAIDSNFRIWRNTCNCYENTFTGWSEVDPKIVRETELIDLRAEEENL